MSPPPQDLGLLQFRATILQSQISFGLGMQSRELLEVVGVVCRRLNFRILLGSDGNALAFSDSAQIAGGRTQDRAGRLFPHSGGALTGQAKAQTKTYQELQTQDVMILMSQGLTAPESWPD